jgi:hypothetical protein
MSYGEALFVVTAGKLGDGLENAKTYVAKTRFGSQGAMLGVQQAPQAAEARDQAIREVHGGAGIATPLQQHCQQFSFGQRGGTGFPKLAAWRFFNPWTCRWHGRSLSGAVRL